MSSREQRQQLARCASELPEQMPPRLRGRPIPLSREVEPHVEALYNEDANFRAAAASINSESSPNGRICFDDRDMASAVKTHADHNGGNPRILNALLGELSTAVKRCMTYRGLGRMQRIKEAKNNLLSGPAPSAQPAE